MTLWSPFAFFAGSDVLMVAISRAEAWALLHQHADLPPLFDRLGWVAWPTNYCNKAAVSWLSIDRVQCGIMAAV